MDKACRVDLLHFLLLCLALALPLAAGQAEPGQARFNGIALQDGDIFLTRSQTILSSLYARHGPNPGKYSHAAIFFYSAQGHPSVMHVQLTPCTAQLDQFSRIYRLIALMRADLTPEQRQRLAATLRSWAADSRILQARFDHTMQDIPGRREQFYCVSLINEIWRSSALPPPFVNQLPPQRTNIQKVLETDFGFDITGIISANTLLTNPEFSLLTEWQNPDYSENSNFILDQVSNAVAGYLKEGYSGRQAGWLSGLVRLSTAWFLGYRLEADRPMYLLALTREYYRKIRNRYLDLQRHGRAPEPGSEEAAGLIRKLCDHYRDDYFTRICQVLPDGTVHPLAAAEQ